MDLCGPVGGVGAAGDCVAGGRYPARGSGCIDTRPAGESYITALAAWRSGVVYQPMFAGFGPAAAAERITSGEPTAIVVDEKYRDKLSAVLNLVDRDLAVYTVAGAGGRGLVHGDRSFWSEIDTHAADAPAVVTAPSDIATLLYTSGTTGAPKGCMMPHSVLLTVQPFVRHVLALQPSDLLFCGANPGWAYGLYPVGFGVMALGHPRVVSAGDFDPRDWLRIVEQERVTYLAAAPTAFRRLLDPARSSGMPDSLRGATCSGEPLDEPLARAWRELAGHHLQDAFGQSEAAMVLANLAFDDRPAVPGAMASVVPGLDIALVDDNGEPQDEQGILSLCRPKYQASAGYRNADPLWEKRWRGDYFLTGDVVRRDEGGQYWFVGRGDDLIVTAGMNVGPSEVENVVLAHDGVAEAAVVAAPDPARGSVVRAVIVLNGHVPADQVTEDVRRAVAEKLGRHAAPRIVDFVDSLPRTETGKIRRNVLRAEK